MSWFSSPDYWLSRFVFQRGLALVYLVAFIVALNQFRPLLGEHGLLPVPRYLRPASFKQVPTIFQWHYSDRFFALVAWTGIVLAACTLFTLTDRAPLPLCMAVWFVMWLLYLSIVNVGQTFYAFGWESLLLETGFLAIFLGAYDTAPPVLLLWLLRWLLFRLEFGAGLIKMRGDECWRNLTCLDYHHETQPMPNPLSWYFHNLPRGVHRIEVLGNHAAQLVAPFLLFTPQPIAGAAAAFMIATQLWLILSGNFSWLNLITIVIAVAAIDGSWLHWAIPASAVHPLTSPLWYQVVVLGVTALVLGLSWWPARNLLSRHQHMNASFTPLHLVNTYGAFGSVTRVRREVVVEGTREEALTPDTLWEEYAFKGKPGDPRRAPRQFAPYHLRLDWLMWFAALSPTYARSWFTLFCVRLLQNDRSTLRLLRRNPFPDSPPTYVRATLYAYRFTTWSERRRNRAWWVRQRLATYVDPIRLDRLTQSVRVGASIRTLSGPSGRQGGG